LAGQGKLKSWEDDDRPAVVVGTFIGIRAGAVVEKDGQVEGLSDLVQVGEETQKVAPV